MLIVCFHAILSHLLPLDHPTQKRKKPCQEPATIGGASHSLLGFLFAVSSRNALHLKNIKIAVRNVTVKTMKVCRVEKPSGKNRNLANTLYIGSKASTKCFCSALFSSAVRSLFLCWNKNQKNDKNVLSHEFLPTAKGVINLLSISVYSHSIVPHGFGVRS